MQGLGLGFICMLKDTEAVPFKSDSPEQSRGCEASAPKEPFRR